MKVVGIVFSNIHDKGVHELTASRTLASVPFAGRFRLIDFVLSNMVNSGITKVGVITKQNYQSLMDHVGSGKYWDLSRKNGGLMVLPPFGADAGSVLYSSRFEALTNIVQFIRRCDEDYVVLSDCDIICNIDFADVVQKHIDNHADITLVYRRQESAGRDRIAVALDRHGRVTAMTQADKLSGENLINTNMYVINREFLLKLIESAAELRIKSFSHDVLMRGVKDYRIYGYEHTGYFALIDSVAHYYKHSLELLDKEKRDGLFYHNGANIYTKVRDSAPLRIEDTARVSDSIIADGCVIEGDVTGSILFRGVRVSKGAVVKNSIVFQNTVICTGSRLNCVIADKNVKILEGRELSGHPTHPYTIAKNTVI